MRTPISTALSSLATSHWPLATLFPATLLLFAGCSEEGAPQKQATVSNASFTRSETQAFAPPSITDPGSPPGQPNATRPPAPKRAPDPFQYQNWGPREMAVDSLGRMGTTALPQLIALLRDPDPEMRVLAAKAISRIGPEASDAVPPLVAAMNDTNPDVRKHVIRALGQIGPKASASIPALVQELREKQ